MWELNHVVCYTSSSPSWDEFSLKSLAFMHLLGTLMCSSHNKSSLLGSRKILLMEWPTSLNFTPKHGLLGKGLPRVGPCMNSTPLAWQGIDGIEHKGFTPSLPFGLTISKANLGLVLLVAHSSRVSFLWMLSSLSFHDLIIRGLGQDRGVNTRLHLLCLSE